MNCADCHGYDLQAAGWVPTSRDTLLALRRLAGGDLQDALGGAAAGDARVGARAPPEQIWKLVTYIQSFHGTFPSALADRGKQGDLGDEDTTSGATLGGAECDQ